MPIDNGPEPFDCVMVSMADLLVRHGGNLLLSTRPLGACLGVAVYDPHSRVGGLLHCLLPDSTIDQQRAATHPGMFLDTGLAGLLTLAQALNAKTEHLRVYAAGCGEILDDAGLLNIGKTSRAALGRLVAERGLRLEGEDLGGLDDRALQLNLATGEVRVKYSGREKLKILCKPSMIT